MGNNKCFQPFAINHSQKSTKVTPHLKTKFDSIGITDVQLGSKLCTSCRTRLYKESQKPELNERSHSSVGSTQEQVCNLEQQESIGESTEISSQSTENSSQSTQPPTPIALDTLNDENSFEVWNLNFHFENLFQLNLLSAIIHSRETK